MPNPRFETAQGSVDGFNRDFFVSEDYTANTLVVFRNGQLLERSLENGWEEMGGVDFRMKIAPLPADIIQAFYMDTLPSEGGYVDVEVEKIQAVVTQAESIFVQMVPDTEVDVVIQQEGSEEIFGIVEEVNELSAMLAATEELMATMKECN